MKAPKIIVHCLVKNEERFVWYAISSVLPYADKIMVWDTGSTDNTVKIIKSIKSEKIEFKEVGNVNSETFTLMRQKMLDETPRDYTWLMVLDGDEVWPGDSLKKVREHINNESKIESIVVTTNNLVGDIYHRQPDIAGKYRFGKLKGHLSLRFVNLKNIPGLHLGNLYGQEGYFDSNNVPIQNRDQNKIKVLDTGYHHATHLKRSSADSLVMQRSSKHKHELGEAIPNQEIPEIFFIMRPPIVPDVSAKRSIAVLLASSVFTIVKSVKRTLFK